MDTSSVFVLQVFEVEFLKGGIKFLQKKDSSAWLLWCTLDETEYLD